MKLSMNMTRTRRTALVWLLLCCGISVFWGYILESASPVGMLDFKAVYYGSRCLIQHSDPYQESEFLRVYQAEGGGFPTDPTQSGLFRRAVPVCINLPTALLLVAPFTILAWGPAHILWMILTAGVIILAAVQRLPFPDLHLACQLREGFFSWKCGWDCCMPLRGGRLVFP
jgi:hypothetical protein